MLKILKNHALHTKLHQYLPNGILPGNSFLSRRYCPCGDPTISGGFLCVQGSLAVTPSTLDRQAFLDDMTLEECFLILSEVHRHCSFVCTIPLGYL